MSELVKIDSDLLEKMLQRDDWHVIDVREPFELEDGFIEGSENHPFSTFSAGELNPQKNHKWVIQCMKGGRAMKIADYLLAHKFPGEIYVLTGGIEAWKEAGKSVHFPQK